MLSLQPRQKWIAPSRNLQVNDIVIVKDDEKPRNQWQLARIVETNFDQDNYVRTVKVAMSSELDSKGRRLSPITILERPINKLILLVENGGV